MLTRRNSVRLSEAQAEFSAHGESYFLVKRAKYAELDAKEFLYFAIEDTLTAERVGELAALSWADGMAKVTPGPFSALCDETEIG